MKARTVGLGLMFCIIACWSSTHAFVLYGARWPTPEAMFFADLLYTGGTSPSNVTWNQAFREGAQSWNDSTVFEYSIIEERSHPCAGWLPSIPEDGFRNGTGFFSSFCGLPFGATTLATSITYYQGNTITESDIVFNSQRAWDVYNGPWRSDVADFRRVTAHELGHSLGLDHETLVDALMNPFIEVGSTIESPLTDDINGVTALYGDLVDPNAKPIVLFLEEPAPGEVKSGVSNLRGWVVGKAIIDRVEFYMDGAYRGNIPVGGQRGDVQAVFPGYPDSRNSGYSQAYNYSALTRGPHTIVVRAFDQIGRWTEALVNFTVDRLDNPFIADPERIDYGSATVRLQDGTLVLSNVVVEGKRYNMTLQWQTATQGYEFIDIQPTN